MAEIDVFRILHDVNRLDATLVLQEKRIGKLEKMATSQQVTIDATTAELVSLKTQLDQQNTVLQTINTEVQAVIAQNSAAGNPLNLTPLATALAGIQGSVGTTAADVTQVQADFPPVTPPVEPVATPVVTP